MQTQIIRSKTVTSHSKIEWGRVFITSRLRIDNDKKAFSSDFHRREMNELQNRGLG